MDDLTRAFTALDRVELLLAESGPEAVLGSTLENALHFLPCVAEFAALRWAWWLHHKEELIAKLPHHSHMDLLRALLPRFRQSGRYSSVSLVNASLVPSGEFSPVPPTDGDWSAGSEFQMFQQRLKDMLARRGVKFANELVGVLDEMAGNSAEHAMSPVLPSACYQFTESHCVIGVTDVGRGVFDSIQDNSSYANISSDSEALRLVLSDGVSRTGECGRGNGFSYVFNKLVDRSCMLRFRAISTAAIWEGRGPASNKLAFSPLPPRIGFHVCIAIPCTSDMRNRGPKTGEEPNEAAHH